MTAVAQLKAAEVRRHEVMTRFGEDVEGWVHHVADLTTGTPMTLVGHDRPLSDAGRLERIKEVFDGLTIEHIWLDERTLSPREPYQQSPLSYLNAWRSWMLWAEANSLQWAESGPDKDYGGLEFWFRNVTPGAKALVTIRVQAASSPGATGHLEVRSSAAGPRLFPIQGFASHTLDLIVTPDDPYGVLVTLEAKDDMEYVEFGEITYTTL